MTEQHWGPRPGAFIFAGVLLLVGVGWMFVASNAGDRFIAGAVMVIVLGAALAGLRMRDRLAASTSGLVVATFSGKRTIPWSDVKRIQMKSTKRLGSTNWAMEIDLVTDELLVFGRMDLGTDPNEVAEALGKLRTGRG